MTNLTNAALSWFVGPSSGDLHLTGDATDAIDHGTQLADVSDDIDKNPRAGTFDIGADELLGNGTSPLLPPTGVTVVN